jgi:PAS domain S-box-containing protein
MKNNPYSNEVLENLVDIITVLSVDGKILYENENLKNFLGYAPEDVVGKNVFEFVHPEDAVLVKNAFAKGLLKLGSQQTVEYRFKHKNGTWVNLESSGKAKLKGIGNIIIIATTRDISGRVKLQKDFSQSQLTLQNIIDLLPVRIFWKDLDLKFIGCNKVLAKDAGKESPAEVIGKTDYEFSWKEQADAYRADDKQVIMSGQSKLNYQEEQTTPTGEKIWLNTNKMPLRDINGKIYGVLGTYIDITAEKRAEIDKSKVLEELKVKNESLEQTSMAMLNILEDARGFERELNRFKVAIDNTTAHVVMTDPDGHIIYANQAAELLTGYTFEEMKGNTPSLWGKQMSHDFYIKLWDTIKNKKQPFEGEIVNKNKKGELYPVFARISPVINETGVVVFFIGNERDITAEKKLAKQMLEEKEKVEKEVGERTKELQEKNSALTQAKEEISEGWFQVQTEKARLLTLVNNIPLGFIMFDHEGKLLLKNPAFEKTLNISAYYADIDSINNALGKDFSVKDNYIKCISTKKQIDIKELSYNGKYFRLLFAPIISGDSKFSCLGVVILIQDITEAKVIDRSKEEFFSIASHELRTPLTAIRGNTALIQQYYGDKINSDKDLAEMINDIHSSSKRLIDIVNDFLNASRLEQGRMKFNKEPVDLVDLAKNVVKEYQATGLLNNLYLKLDPPSEEMPKVFSDLEKTRQVIINFIGNAIKCTEKGGITVVISKDEGFVKLSVSDTGRGIEKNQQGLLFKKFVQTEQSILTRDTTQGTGLGLYISKLMIEGMGGQIQLEKSEVNVGSVFSFSLPIQQSVSNV